MELFHKILKAAVEGHASDIHIKVGTPVVFRISRELISIDCPIPTEQWLNNVVSQMTPAHMKKRLEEDREVDFSYNVNGMGRFRTNVFQQRGTWALAMRYVKSSVPSFEQLGLLDQIKSLAETPRGIVVVAGSTGSGKSTTLAAMIEHVNANFKKHIVTLEDPIEYVFEDNQSVIEQREIGLDAASFHGALKHVLRQDPDIIMIGEMRDATSFMAAMSAADTGHLVFSTVHTTNSSQSITRILDFFSADEREQVRRQLATCLRAVICQRMAKTVSGGMTPAIEIMINTPAIGNLIREGKTAQLYSQIQTGGQMGMQTLERALANLVQQGAVSRDEAMSKAGKPEELGRLLDDPFDPRCTEWLVEIPTEVSWANIPGADAVEINNFSAMAQFDFYMQVQKHYTAHNTSATVEFRDNEIEPLADAIHRAIDNGEGYISAALLARFDANATFPRLPFEPIDHATYERLQNEVVQRRRTSDFFEALQRYDSGELMEAGPAGCDSDKCLLPLAKPSVS